MNMLTEIRTLIIIHKIKPWDNSENIFFSNFFFPENVTKLGKPCDGNHLPVGCGVNQECVFNTNKTFRCYCAQNFVESNGECLKISTTAAASIDPADQQYNKSSSFCCARRYRLLPCRQNTYGNVLVTRDEDDDDDPPIA
ncbi:hypothetical protein G9C98_001519 [Cotesia typhae]|uniref:EGF-like domain-containing protein n=1 Tax=Cotesia typhae TaxID=2053667 RepID=A0A8J5QVV7_9HYME|nr:hypothetical protein G9C98_001519 [Cotesia typhae]